MRIFHHFSEKKDVCTLHRFLSSSFFILGIGDAVTVKSHALCFSDSFVYTVMLEPFSLSSDKYVIFLLRVSLLDLTNRTLFNR